MQGSAAHASGERDLLSSDPDSELVRDDQDTTGYSPVECMA